MALGFALPVRAAATQSREWRFNLLGVAVLSILCDNSSSSSSSTTNNKAIYQYLRIHSLNHVFGSLVIAISFVSYSPRYLQFSLTMAARYHRCVLINGASTLYFFQNVLDVVIALERLSLLVPWLRRFRTKSPHMLCLLLFLLCSLINSPTYFLAWPKSDAEFYNLTQFTDAYCSHSDFFSTLNGKTIIFVVFFFRDLLPIVVEITFSVLSVYQLRRIRVNKLCGGDAHIAESERQLIVITVYILIVSCASHFVVFLFYLSFAFGLLGVFDGWLSFLVLFCFSLSFILNFFIIFFYSRVFRDCLKGIIRLKRFQLTY